jgi:hypothetical protein
MDKYYISKKTTLTDCCELSVSNDIIKRENLLTVLDIVRKWVKQVFPTSHYIVYYKGDFEKATIDDMVMYDPNVVGDPYVLHVVHAPSNVRFRIGIYKTEYITNRVVNNK